MPIYDGVTTQEPSAVGQFDSTVAGFLIPRMTTAQRTAIASPATSLLVYDTDLGAVYIYIGGWVALSGSSGTTTGTGAAVFANTPTLITPVLGAATGSSLTLTNTGSANMLIENGDGVAATIQLNSYNAVSASTATNLNFRRGRGSLGTPAATTSGDRLGTYTFAGEDTVPTFVNAVQMIASVSNTVGAGSVPGKMQFLAIPGIGDTALKEYLNYGASEVVVNDTSVAFNFRVETDGNANTFFTDGTNDRVGFYTGSPTYDLSIGGNAARTVSMERHTTSNTAGNNLTLVSGGATSGATDKSSGALILAPGLSTGTGGSKLRMQRTTSAVSTGTSDNSLVDVFYAPSVFALANNTTTSVIDIALPSGEMFQGKIEWGVAVRDGTERQSFSGIANFAAVNKAGAYTTTVTQDTANDAKAVSAGTITCTWTLVSGTNKVTIKVNVNSSLTPSTGFPKLFYTFTNNSEQVPSYL